MSINNIPPQTPIKGFFNVEGGGSSLLPHQLPQSQQQQQQRAGATSSFSQHFFESQTTRQHRQRNSRRSLPRHPQPRQPRHPHHQQRHPPTYPSRTHTATSFSFHHAPPQPAPRTSTSMGLHRSSGQRSEFRSAEVECSIHLAETTSIERRKSQYQRPMHRRPMTTKPKVSKHRPPAFLQHPPAHGGRATSVEHQELVNDYLLVVDDNTLKSSTDATTTEVSDTLIDSAFQGKCENPRSRNSTVVLRAQ